MLTALLLKLVLEVVVLVKNRAKGRLRAATTARGKLLGGFLLWLVVFGSKFVVLSLEDLILGSAVELGGFISVTLLILALLVSRAAVRWVLRD